MKIGKHLVQPKQKSTPTSALTTLKLMSCHWAVDLQWHSLSQTEGKKEAIKKKTIRFFFCYMWRAQDEELFQINSSLLSDHDFELVEVFVVNFCCCFLFEIIKYKKAPQRILLKIALGNNKEKSSAILCNGSLWNNSLTNKEFGTYHAVISSGNYWNVCKREKRNGLL